MYVYFYVISYWLLVVCSWFIERRQKAEGRRQKAEGRRLLCRKF
jgi:hypothetical protein